MNNLVKELLEVKRQEKEVIRKIVETKDSEAHGLFNLFDTSLGYLVDVRGGKIFIKNDYICDYKDFIDAAELLNESDEDGYTIRICIKDLQGYTTAIYYKTKDRKMK